MGRKKRKKGRRGEGHVEELPSGSYRVEVPCGRDPDTGKPRKVRKTFPAGRHAAAVAWKNEQLSLAAAGKLAAPTTLTVAAWLDRWLALQKPDWAPKTYRHDHQRANRWLKPRLGTVNLAALTGEAVRAMLAGMAAEGASDSERQKAGAVLRKALNAAVVAGHLAVSPMRHVRLPTPKRPEKRVWTEEEVGAVLRAADPRGYGHVFRLWLDTGLRPGEVFGLHWDDLDLDAGTVTIRRSLDADTHQLKPPKTRRSRRTLPVSEETVLALRAARTPDAGPIVCPDTEGGYFWESNFARWVFGPIAEAAGVPWAAPYTCRHSAASLMLQAGISIKVVSERLGHEDVTTTLRTYAHLLPGMQEKAAEVMGNIFRKFAPIRHAEGGG